VGSIPASRTNFCMRMAQKKFWAIFLFCAHFLLTVELALKPELLPDLAERSRKLGRSPRQAHRTVPLRVVGMTLRFRGKLANFFYQSIEKNRFSYDGWVRYIAYRKLIDYGKFNHRWRTHQWIYMILDTPLLA
jgi:hypothetical protein